MFKRFSSEQVSAQNQVKAYVQRKIRRSIAEEYPGLEPILDEILPKKSPLIVAKCVRDGPCMPTLRLVQKNVGAFTCNAFTECSSD